MNLETGNLRTKNCHVGPSGQVGSLLAKADTPILLLLAAIFYFLGLTPALAADQDVINLNDNGAGSLREAIATVGVGENITFSTNGTITLTTGQLNGNNTMNIIGPGSGSLTIDAGGTNRAFNITDAGTVISGLTITNGREGNGGGIYTSKDLTISNVVIAGCTATNAGGGGLYCYIANMTIVDCVISNNTSANQGGGCVFYFNGKANKSEWNITNTRVVNNTSASSGGGIYVRYWGRNRTLRFTDCVISDNTATGSDGGAVHLWTSLGINIFERCTMSGNTCGDDGGAVFLDNGGGTLQIVNCTLSGNTASDDGGGICMNRADATLQVFSSTIVSNNGDCGGIRLNLVDDACLYNTIIAGNTDSDLEDASGEFGAIDHCLYGNALDIKVGTNVLNIVTNDAGIGALADNGGVTLTHALLESSAAINAGGMPARWLDGDRFGQVILYSEMTGVASGNTDIDGHQYLAIVDAGGGTYQLNLYKDSTRTQLVGHTTAWTPADALENLAVTATNGSGLGGTIMVDKEFVFAELSDTGGTFDNPSTWTNDITGTSSNNLDGNGILYVKVLGSVAEDSLEFYRDFDMTMMVATTATYSAPGLITINEVNSSGLGGSIEVSEMETADCTASAYVRPFKYVDLKKIAFDQRGYPYARTTDATSDIGAHEYGSSPVNGPVFILR